MVTYAVCLIAAAAVTAVLLHSSRPVPRHVFIFDMVAKLSHNEVEDENATQSPLNAAA